ncbi:ABC transporter permease [Halosimplex sp. TS25]|uniref:ABC transporter permease n=1 Tax=Halosimplex rarum TaxID=3396619 RepID=UPI0039EB9B59
MSEPDSEPANGTQNPERTDGRSEARPDGGATAHAAPTAAERLSADTARQALGVARREYRVLSRARWTDGLALLFGAFSLAVVGLTGTATGPTSVGALLVSLAELSVYLIPLAALALGYGTVVGADERGTLELLLAVPLGRSALLAGKFLGRAAAFAVGTTVGLGVGGIVVALRFGPAVLPAYLHYTLTAVSVGVAFLSLGVCISAAASEKARALGGALLAWVLFVLVYDLAALGVVVALDPPGWVLTALAVANPADVLRLVVLSLVPTAGGGVGAALATTTVSTLALLASLALWVVVPLAVGGRLLGRRA